MRKEAVDAIVKNLKEHPEEWEFTHYWASNRKRGIEIWVANSLYGLSVNGEGGVTTMSCLFSWFIPWRFRIWKAVQHAKSNRIMEKFA